MSEKYRLAMKEPLRNRAYAKVYMGMFNSEATKKAYIPSYETQYYTYYSNTKELGTEKEIQEYATCEQNGARLDNTMYFLPPEGSRYTFYNNGLVLNSVGTAGYTMAMYFGSLQKINGLTIDFGENYPTSLIIAHDKGNNTYTLNSRYFETSDVFETSSLYFVPQELRYGENSRFRIFSILFGRGYRFNNEQIESISCSDYISSVTDTIPSRDLTVKLLNVDGMFSPDNPESVSDFIEIGQNIQVEFGMTLDDGTVEWTPQRYAYLKTWSADKNIATFVATDRFDNMTDIFYNGVVSYKRRLSELAEMVFQDMGLKYGEYYIAPILYDIYVDNPIPPVRHSEALQIIANAGRCVLFEGEDGKIHIESSFIPDGTVTGSFYYALGSLRSVLNQEEKLYLPFTSYNNVRLDGKTVFYDKSYMGFVSAVSRDDGTFSVYSEFTIVYDVPFTSYDFTITFDGTPPEYFTIYYGQSGGIYDGEQETIYTEGNNIIKHKVALEKIHFLRFEFKKTPYPNSRIYVNNVKFGAHTNYQLTYDKDLTDVPSATKENKLKNLKIAYTKLSLPYMSEEKVLKTETFYARSNETYYIYLTNPSIVTNYEFSRSVSVYVETYTSNYRVKLQFNSISEGEITCTLKGREYVADTSYYVSNKNGAGEEVVWNNPLVSTPEHAKQIAEWLDDFYEGDVSYRIPWRGDPSTEANDMFLLELKDQEEKSVIRAYKNTINFNGAFSGELEARKAVL